LFWASGSVGPCRHALSQPWRVPKLEPLANPLLGKWLCVLKDARPCRIFQCRYLSNLVGANSHRRSLSLLSTPRENCFLPENHSRPCAFVLPTFANGSPACPTPLEITAPTRELVKVRQSCPPQSHSRLAFCAAQHREWLRSGERSVPPTGQTFHCEFSTFSIFLLILAN
jgi:hypothetical protein